MSVNVNEGRIINEQRNHLLSQNPFQIPLYFLIIVTSYKSFDAIRTHLDTTSKLGGVSPFALIMLVNVMVGVVLIISRMYKSKKISSIILVAIIYIFIAVASTSLSGLYPFTRIPFRLIELSYWVVVLIISYYYSKMNCDIDSPIFVTTAVLPLFFLSFLSVFVDNVTLNRDLLLNNVYYLLFLLPFVLTLKSNILKNIGILIIFAAVVLSLKRTAIISLVISLLYYFYSVREVIRKGLPQKIKFLFITVISVFIGYILFNQLTRTFSIDWVGRLSTLLIDGGSGRDVLWKYTWAALLDQNIFQWILGNGYRATEYLGGAHNDFLEVLFDFGIMGLGAYLLFIVLLIKSFFQMKKDKYPNYPAFGVSLIIFIFGSIFSQLVILPHWFLYLPLYWGLIIPHYYRSKISLPFVKHSSNQ